MSETKNQPKEEVVGRTSLRTSRQKLQSGPPNPGKKQAFWHGHAAWTSTKKLQSEKLRADFSFPRLGLTPGVVLGKSGELPGKSGKLPEKSGKLPQNFWIALEIHSERSFWGSRRGTSGEALGNSGKSRIFQKLGGAWPPQRHARIVSKTFWPAPTYRRKPLKHNKRPVPYASRCAPRHTHTEHDGPPNQAQIGTTNRQLGTDCWRALKILS